MRTTGAASEPAVVFVSKRFPLASRWRPRRSPVAADAAGRRFAPGLWPTALTLLGVAVLIALGTWQLERLAMESER